MSLTLAYRIFSDDHPLGDFAGISMGVKNGGYGFDLSDRDETLEIRYYALFGTLDLSLLKITGGYAFGADQRYRKEDALDNGENTDFITSTLLLRPCGSMLYWYGDPFSFSAWHAQQDRRRHIGRESVSAIPAEIYRDGVRSAGGGLYALRVACSVIRIA